ncbi:DUF2142 domain-containing protein [Candidatus Sumerlaeota bacterium]|nr:DUF2142 domain-containing protein [Candidatus Sumerlaeota bacterium]
MSPSSGNCPGWDVACLAAIVLVGVAIGALYAAETPRWHVPDEPAHFDYVRHVAETGRIPVLRAGDYDQSYLESLLARGFPRDMSIAPLRYENHQPPLYYALGAVAYRLSGGSLLALRLMGAIIASGLPIFAFLVARLLCPDGGRRVPLAAAAFVAFLPQNVFVSAGVNNDGLANLLAAIVLWLSLRLLREPGPTAGRRVVLGIVVGLGFLTKATFYPVALVPLVAECMTWRRSGRRLAGLGQIVLPAVLIAAPWWVRNLAVYGWPDFLGLIRHGVVVAGQPRTADWIASYGFAAWATRAARFTFQSFWAQFGWMSIPVDFRFYLGFALFSVLSAFGLIVGTVWKGDDSGEAMKGERGLAVLSVCAALVGLIVYNLTFVQHQGRYLFVALAPIAVGAASGWDRAIEPKWARWAAAGLGATLAVLVAQGVLLHDLPGWKILFVGAAACFLVAGTAMGSHVRNALFVGPFSILPLLDIWLLFGWLIPIASSR